MEHYWKTAGIKPDLSKRLDGSNVGEGDYKYNSLLVLSKDSGDPPVYVFPRHKAGEWIVKMKGLFLTIISLSDDIASDGVEVSNSDKDSDSSKKSDGISKKSVNSDSSKRSEHNAKECVKSMVDIYHVKLQVHGGPVHCCIASFSNCIFVLSSDSCSDMSHCVTYLHDTLSHFIPHSHNSLLNSAAETTRVVDSYIAPALEITGVSEWITLPFNHRDQVISGDLQDTALDIEVKVDMGDKVCVSCGGLLVVSYPDIVYSSLPAHFQQAVLQTLYFRELLTITQGYIIWFNKLYKHSFRVKKQDWYLLTVSKNNMSVSQLLGIFGEPDKDHVIRASRDLENLLDTHGTEIRQHLPCQAITLTHSKVLGYKYGDNRAFYCETRYQSVVEYHHAQEDSGVRSAGRFVVALEEGVHVAQRVIAKKVFTVVYESKGVHDVDTMFRELGI